MVRERRQTFDQASPPKKIPRQRRAQTKQPIQPVRVSKRLRGIAPPDSSLDVILSRKRRSRSQSNSRKDEENDSQSFESVQAKRIAQRRVTVALERLNTDRINELQRIEVVRPEMVSSQPSNIFQRQIEQLTSKRLSVSLIRMTTDEIKESLATGKQPERRMTADEANGSSAKVTAKKCTTRRCTVYLERFDWSRHQMPQRIPENEQENDAIEEVGDAFEPPEPVELSLPDAPADDDAIEEPIEVDHRDDISTVSTERYSELISTDVDQASTQPLVSPQQITPPEDVLMNESMENNVEIIPDQSSVISTISRSFHGFSSSSSVCCRRDNALQFQLPPSQNVVRVSNFFFHTFNTEDREVISSIR